MGPGLSMTNESRLARCAGLVYLVVVVTGCVFDDTVGSIIAQQPVHIGEDGPEVLSCSPFWNPDGPGDQP